MGSCILFAGAAWPLHPGQGAQLTCPQELVQRLRGDGRRIECQREDRRREVAQSAVRSDTIVIVPPEVDRRSGLGEIGEPLEVTPTNRGLLAVRPEPVERVLANRLEHPEPLAVVANVSGGLITQDMRAAVDADLAKLG